MVNIKKVSSDQIEFPKSGKSKLFSSLLSVEWVVTFVVVLLLYRYQ